MAWRCETLTTRARHVMPALVLPALILTSCFKPIEPSAVVLATVAGHPVTQEIFDAYVMQRTGLNVSSVDSDQKAALLDDLLKISAATLMSPQPGEPLADVNAELRRLESASRIAATAAGVFRMPTDEELRAEYERFVVARPSVEYRAAHILVPTQAQAQEIVEHLASGKDFAALAIEFSVDQSAGEGGDLGWLDPTVLPGELFEAARALAPGAYSPRPVKTKYGWHVLHLIETRPAAAVPLQQVRTQLVLAIQQRRYRDFLDSAIVGVKIVRMSS